MSSYLFAESAELCLLYSDNSLYSLESGPDFRLLLLEVIESAF